MNNGVIVALLGSGGFAFLTALITPIITRRLNKVDAAATNAEKVSGSAVKLVEGLEKRLEKTESACSECIDKLGSAHKALDAVHAALLEIVPLLPGGAKETMMLRAAIRTVERARYED